MDEIYAALQLLLKDLAMVQAQAKADIAHANHKMSLSTIRDPVRMKMEGQAHNAHIAKIKKDAASIGKYYTKVAVERALIRAGYAVLSKDIKALREAVVKENKPVGRPTTRSTP